MENGMENKKRGKKSHLLVAGFVTPRQKQGHITAKQNSSDHKSNFDALLMTRIAPYLKKIERK